MQSFAKVRELIAVVCNCSRSFVVWSRSARDLFPFRTEAISRFLPLRRVLVSRFLLFPRVGRGPPSEVWGSRVYFRVGSRLRRDRVFIVVWLFLSRNFDLNWPCLTSRRKHVLIFSTTCFASLVSEFSLARLPKPSRADEQ